MGEGCDGELLYRREERCVLGGVWCVMKGWLYKAGTLWVCVQRQEWTAIVQHRNMRGVWSGVEIRYTQGMLGVSYTGCVAYDGEQVYRDVAE